MKEYKYYNEILKGDEGVLKRALYKSMGFTDEALEKPLVAIVNTYTNATPGHYNINEMCDHVKSGIEAAGGTAMIFGSIAPCDGIAEGHDGMRYSLPSRDIITSSVECMVRAHKFDGVVLLGSCDKIVPGLLMSAARLDIPAIFCNSGPMLPTIYNGENYDGNIATEAVGWKQRGEIDDEEFKKIENLAEPCIGSCSMFGTANTMACLAEALGMSLPGCAVIPAVEAKRMRMAYDSGRQILKLIEKGLNARQIITKESILNAVAVLIATGGSTNAVMHLQAIYHEAGLGELPLDVFGEYSNKIPQILSIYPASKTTILDFHHAGGVQALMKKLKDKLYLDEMTVSLNSLGENLEQVDDMGDSVIKSVEDPYSHKGGLTVLKGNIAPLGSVTKPAAIPENLKIFEGIARVFESEDESCKAILSGEIKEGTIVVIRYEGPKGGPGMPEMYRPMKHLEGMNLSSSCALITDGRFSGSNRGCFVGHISPEAFEGGIIALVEDGDKILIDVIDQKIELLVDDETLEKRKEHIKIPEKFIADGYLNIYKKISKSAAQGAVVE